MKQETALVVGGAGAVGTLFCELLCKYYPRIVVVDLDCSKASQMEGVECIQGDINDAEARDLLREARLVLLAIPEASAIEAIASIGNSLQAGQCLIDTMSVKSSIVEHLSMLKPSFEVISINPMFGPSLGFQNQSVAVVEVRAGPISSEFLSMIRDAGAIVVPVTAEGHDRYAAAVQAATHAAILSFGMTLAKLNYVPDHAKPVWTPPHKTLLALLARMLATDPEVYRDIQASNPFAEEAREAMKDSVIELNRIVLSGHPEEFRRLTERIEFMIEKNQGELAELAQRIFNNI